MTDVLVDELVENTRKQFAAKLDELRPAHEQYLKLEGIIANFDGIANGATPRGGGSARRRGTTATADRASRGQRPQEFVGLVRENPGITVSEAAEKMDGMNPNYLYRLAKDLTAGETPELRKDGKGYYVIDAE